ncbi:MAG: 4-hydroxythreonine-4-phosphate dehydrogenase PdxA [Candidatus Aminicenantes bacterium]|nr:4-hydroxythreonine-4-phosphate dehydrogenase PdxA [Candidatus Aminicenantes bacterium]
MNSPRIGLTLGDPGGIGPEIVLRLLQKDELPPGQIIIFGKKEILKLWALRLGMNNGLLEDKIKEGRLMLEEIGAPLKELTIGKPTVEGGKLSFEFFRQAVKLAGTGQLEALVTGPVSKISWAMAGLPYRGHTEYLEHLYPGCMMSFWSERLRLVLFTHHLPLREALKKIKKAEIKNFLLNLERNLKSWPFGIKEILVCGLNPHAGEDGTIGNEEEMEIKPAIKEMSESAFKISGPFPADTIFLQALDHPERLVLSLYHDQGLVAFKLVSFMSGVNLTLGLPFIRTSPDHGTAYDLAGRGEASTGSMKEALWLAQKLVSSKD